MKKTKLIIAIFLISLLTLTFVVSAKTSFLDKILDKKHKTFDKYLVTHEDFLIANPSICQIDADCMIDEFGENSCVNKNLLPPDGQILPPWFWADSCSCVNHVCVGSQEPWPTCGDGFCDAGDLDRCPEDCS